ncbi:hypothetical protein SE17_06730 [Kouleothrix aurantiaca]|uniref:Uncharacterized protein n=1 Tax=Kouleothrix aurantiaca TaxID=186479 RepID=A0A0P9D7U3_9CHLR|nr:hypothetical protein SE17_06730 [Kouleothrix aurantiaca]
MLLPGAASGDFQLRAGLAGCDQGYGIVRKIGSQQIQCYFSSFAPFVLEVEQPARHSVRTLGVVQPVLPPPNVT